MCLNINAQKVSTYSLRKALLIANEDTTKIKLLQAIGSGMLLTMPDSSLILYKQALAIARQDKLLRQGMAIGKINIVSQDIGRVLWNLYNNAFYAVNEKRKLQGEGYEPTVSINTKKINDMVEISIEDNGNGISEKLPDKIFQPFFTTKPTGLGTGLGLSLAYDIVKAHGGQLKVDTTNEEGASFII